MLYRMNDIKGNNQSRGKGCMSTVVNNEHKNDNVVAEGHLEFRLPRQTMKESSFLLIPKIFSWTKFVSATTEIFTRPLHCGVRGDAAVPAWRNSSSRLPGCTASIQCRISTEYPSELITGREQALTMHHTPRLTATNTSYLFARKRFCYVL